MKKLALDHELLMRIDKAARYTGGEVGSVVKDKNTVDIRVAFAFPDVYEIGMSNLGMAILYDMFNQREDVWCERVFSPWTDLTEEMEKRQIPLFALESQDPVRSFDFFCITMGYEMCYTNVLSLLDLAGIPLEAKDRTEDDPLVVGGGACACNPEPMAAFFDLFYIGEGEVVYDALFDAYKEAKKEGLSREEFLIRAASLPGIYVPSLYEVSYAEDGSLLERKALCGAPEVVKRQLVMDLNEGYHEIQKPVIPFIKATQDRVTLEIMRGCIRGCRFCQAGMIYRPCRERNVEGLMESARQMLGSSGHEEISLSSLSSSDYSCLKNLVYFLIENYSEEAVNISLPSLRIDAFALDVMGKVQDVKKSSLTFAPEAGTQRMRDVINKGLTEEEILRGAGEAFSGGWNKVKLYFMLGLPGEREEDVKGIAHLAEKIAERYYEIPKDQRQGKVQVSVSTSFFVPKPFTPFQWAGMFTPADYIEKAKTVKGEIREQLNQRSIRYAYHEPDVTVLEGFLARGDRRCAAVIKRAYELGCRFDAWSENFRFDLWQQAFAETGIDMDYYTLRERPVEEKLPWDFLDMGVSKSFLIREWNRARQEQVTPNCRQACSACGMASWYGEEGCPVRREKA